MRRGILLSASLLRYSARAFGPACVLRYSAPAFGPACVLRYSARAFGLACVLRYSARAFGPACVLLAACSPAAGHGRTAAGGGASVEAVGELPRAADRYTSDPAPYAARGPEAEQLDRALSEATRRRGMSLIGDGRLNQLAAYIGARLDPTGKPPASANIDAFAHRLGLIEPVPLFMVFGQSQAGSWAQSVEEMLNGVRTNVPYNRYGLAIAAQLGQRVAVVFLSAASAEIEPVARQIAPGSTIRLRGRLRRPYTHPQLEVTLPDGSVQHGADQTGTAMDFKIGTATRGVYRVEILADGPFGLEVLANFPVFAGIEEPPLDATPIASSRDAAEPADTATVAAKLLDLLNQARKTARVPLLQAHPGLAEVAEAHSRDMVEGGFFGHVSPVYGDPSARVRRKGLAFVLIAENVGRGSTAEEVNTMLLDSPGHRANALDPNLTHVGIGVVLDRGGGRANILATEEFGGIPKTIDVRTAPGEVVKLINARRAELGARKLEIDTTLTDAAQKGAALFFQE